jgi:hypothetical protein
MSRRDLGWQRSGVGRCGRRLGGRRSGRCWRGGCLGLRLRTKCRQGDGNGQEPEETKRQ